MGSGRWEVPLGWGGREESMIVKAKSKKIIIPIANYLGTNIAPLQNVSGCKSGLGS